MLKYDDVMYSGCAFSECPVAHDEYNSAKDMQTIDYIEQMKLYYMEIWM